jgi:hypothetical protein
VHKECHNPHFVQRQWQQKCGCSCTVTKPFQYAKFEAFTAMKIQIVFFLVTTTYHYTQSQPRTLPFEAILVYEGVTKSFRTGRLERELQIVQLSATRCSCIAILWVSLVSFAAVTLFVASQRVFIVVVYFVLTQSGNFWIYPRIYLPLSRVGMVTCTLMTVIYNFKRFSGTEFYRH